MSAHTPGWRYEESTKTIRAVPSNHWIATMGFDGAEDHEANAHLIAAAPVLLEALRSCESALFHIMADDPDVLHIKNSDQEAARIAITEARAAIAEANCTRLFMSSLPYPCPLCRSQYNREGMLAQHVYLCHPKEDKS